jgi:capsid protein
MANHARRIAAQWGSFPAADDPRARNIASGGSADYHATAMERKKLREKSRAAERGNPHAAAAYANATRLIVGAEGPEPSFPELPTEVQQVIQAKWWADSYAMRFDAAGFLTWGQLCQTLVQSVIRDGAILVWRDGSGSSMLYEIDRVPELITDPMSGRIEKYLVAPLGPNGKPLTDKKKLKPVSIDEATMPAWRTRAGQTHGLPVLTPGLHWLERLASLEEAEIISAEASSLNWAVIKSAANGNNAMGPVLGQAVAVAEAGTYPGEGHQDGPLSQVPPGWNKTDAGNMMAVPEGLEVENWTPGRPNMDVPAFVKAVLRRVCDVLLPYEVLFADVGQLSFAAVRSIGKIAEHNIRFWRKSIIETTTDLIALDWLRSNFPQYYTEGMRTEWRYDDLVIRDREKEASAAKTELANGTSSKQSLLGPDWKIIQQQREEEERIADEASVRRIAALAKQVESSGVGGLHWAHIATLGGAATAPAGYAAATVPPVPEVAPEPRQRDDEDQVNAQQFQAIMAAVTAHKQERPAVEVHNHTQQIIEASQVQTLGEAIAASIRFPEIPQSIVNVSPSFTVEAAQVDIPAPVIHVTNEVAAPIVNVPQQNVTVENTVNVPQQAMRSTTQHDGSVITEPVKKG